MGLIICIEFYLVLHPACNCYWYYFGIPSFWD
jgi:hypothetical protein